jgi:HPt (histidine-containing phosphotransfer) domain-containing protein
MTGFANTKQWKKLTLAAHSLRSSALIVGAKELSLLCENLEGLDYKDRNRIELKKVWHKVDSSIKQLIYLLQKELNNNEH